MECYARAPVVTGAHFDTRGMVQETLPTALPPRLLRGAAMSGAVAIRFRTPRDGCRTRRPRDSLARDVVKFCREPFSGSESFVALILERISEPTC